MSQILTLSSDEELEISKSGMLYLEIEEDGM